jgi:hypothetical protein
VIFKLGSAIYIGLCSSIKGGAEKGGRRGRKTEKRGIRGVFKNKEKRGGG